MSYSTRQRQLIEQILLQTERSLTIDEIWKLGLQALPQLGRATVFRTVKLLSEEARLRKVELPGHAPRYEPVDRARHPFFLCETCHQAFDLPPVSGIDPRITTGEGFKADHMDVVLYGRCPTCD